MLCDGVRQAPFFIWISQKNHRKKIAKKRIFLMKAGFFPILFYIKITKVRWLKIFLYVLMLNNEKRTEGEIKEC